MTNFSDHSTTRRPTDL